METWKLQFISNNIDMFIPFCIAKQNDLKSFPESDPNNYV